MRNISVDMKKWVTKPTTIFSFNQISSGFFKIDRIETEEERQKDENLSLSYRFLMVVRKWS